MLQILFSRPLQLAARFALALAVCMYAQASFGHVEETDTIDLVSNNKEKTEVYLGIVQHLPWNERTFALLRRKVATYEAFVQHGELQRRLPQTAEMAVIIEVAYFVEPDAEALAQLQKLASSLGTSKLKLRWFKLPSAK